MLHMKVIIIRVTIKFKDQELDTLNHIELNTKAIGTSVPEIQFKYEKIKFYDLLNVSIELVCKKFKNINR